VRLTTVGVGAQNSPRYAPAGLLVAHRGVRVMIDGGPGATPRGHLDAWLVTDERAELIADIRRLARDPGLTAGAVAFARGELSLEPRPVVHTGHPTYGYLIRAAGRTAVWAPEFIEFPVWAAGVDLMFAEAAAWDRPIRFAGGVGGHLPVLVVAEEAQRRRVKRLVLARVGRPTIRAIDRGERPPFGAFALDARLPQFVVTHEVELRG
jgi:hypothetical protein